MGLYGVIWGYKPTFTCKPHLEDIGPLSSGQVLRLRAAARGRCLGDSPTDFTTELAADLEKAGQPGVRLGRPGPGGRYGEFSNKGRRGGGGGGGL